MMSIYDNKIPFGLLDDDTANRLRSFYDSGGLLCVYEPSKMLCHSGGQWAVIRTCTWGVDKVYRALGEFGTKPNVDWSIIDSRYVWLFKNSHTNVYVSTLAPNWNERDGHWVFNADWARVDVLTSTDLGTCEPKDSLVYIFDP